MGLKLATQIRERLGKNGSVREGVELGKKN